MGTYMNLSDREIKYIDKMDEYIAKLKHTSPENAYREAKKALLRTGVITRFGKLREGTVSMR